MTSPEATMRDQTMRLAAEQPRSQFDDANDWLNARVTQKIDVLQAAGETLPAEMDWVARNEHQIYQRRFKPMIWLVLVGSAIGMAQAPSFAAFAIAFVALYFIVDFYSGVLHVVLDNPRFCELPLMGVPCVEFQWHHTFPHDISSRRMLDVWGDLNVLLTVKLVCLLALAGVSPLTFMVAGVGFFWGYMNQWSHRLCHTAPARRPAFGRWLQERGVLLNPDVHQIHHSDHTQAFPVLCGRSRALVQWMTRVMPNQWAWLVLFVVLTAADLVVATWALRALGLG